VSLGLAVVWPCLTLCRTVCRTSINRGRPTVGPFAAFAATITNLRAGDRWRTQVAAVRKLNDVIIGHARKRV
jgi:hypothetical protein